MNQYKLLTPGPLTTTDSVKKEMMADRCTWDDDYKAVTQDIRRRLLKLAGVSDQEYTTVLMQGSGTFGVESIFFQRNWGSRKGADLFQRRLWRAHDPDL